MTGTRPTARLELDPARIRRIIDAAVVVSTEVVNFHFNSLDGANLSETAQPPNAPLFGFRGGKLTAEQRRSLIENWVLAKAFQELLRAIRHALEIAHVFTSLLGKSHIVRSDTLVADFLRPFEAKAQSLKFPQLLDEVNGALATELEFASSYRSLQSVRNCLEHRSGIVGMPETHGKEHFDFSVPRMKVFYLRDGIEVEIEKGQAVDPGDSRVEVQVFGRIEERKRSLALGEKIRFTHREFNEVAFACHFLGHQLASKMPNPDVA